MFSLNSILFIFTGMRFTNTFAGYLSSIPGSGRSPGEGNSNALQYPCLKNSMDRGAWQVTVHGAAKSRTGLRD